MCDMGGFLQKDVHSREFPPKCAAFLEVSLSATRANIEVLESRLQRQLQGFGVTYFQFNQPYFEIRFKINLSALDT